MNHFVLLLYLISGFSGVSSIIYLLGKYGHNTPFMKGYIRVYVTYTSMMLVSLIILYLKENVLTADWLMLLFIVSILVGQGFLLYSLAGFSFAINNKGISSKVRRFWKFFPSVYFLLGIVQIFIWNTPFTLVPVIVGAPLFVGLSLWFSFRNHKLDQEEGKWKSWIWIAFVIYTIIIIGIDFYLKFRWNLFEEYSLNIPLIYLAWNALSLIQFYKENQKEENHTDDLTINEQKAIQWELSTREIEIAEGILQGLTNKEIASDLSISASTVKNHIYNIYRKTGVQSRVELVNILR